MVALAWSILGRSLVFAFAVGIVLVRDHFGSLQAADKASSLIRSISTAEWISAVMPIKWARQTSAKCTHCLSTKRSAPSAECSVYSVHGFTPSTQSVLPTCCSFSHSCSILPQTLTVFAESNWQDPGGKHLYLRWLPIMITAIRAKHFQFTAPYRLIATLYRFTNQMRLHRWLVFFPSATVAVILRDRSK